MAQSYNKKGMNGQVSMFDLGGEQEENNLKEIKYQFSEQEEMSEKEKLSMEKEMLGIYISGHPLEKIKEQIKQLTNISSKELKEIDEQNSSGENDEGKVQEKLEYEDGQEVRIAGLITSVKKKYTKNNKIMAFVTIEDLNGSAEIIIFEPTFLRCQDKLLEENIIIIKGRLSIREDENTKIIAQEIKNFGENTYPELIVALANLSKQGFSNLVIDLRDNTGGYLKSAVQMANEFLPKNKLIVYTQGRKSPRQDYRSDGRGAYQQIPLVVLINESSASASEIFAGAMQDNDRASIIGRRSFGKGLVQQQIEFPDGSMIRLTIARYYTPSGRCIQKPYVPGDEEDYELDIMQRYTHGEFFSQDSIKHTGPAYHTGIGRVVYGGGGITPDIFVPEDTTDVTSYYKLAATSGLMLQFAYEYTDNNRQKLKAYDTMQDLAAYLSKQGIVEKFATYAEAKGLKRRNLLIKRSHKLLERFLVSRIIYNMLDEEAWTQYINIDDPVIMKTMKVFEQNAAFPKLPSAKKASGRTALSSMLTLHFSQLNCVAWMPQSIYQDIVDPNLFVPDFKRDKIYIA